MLLDEAQRYSRRYEPTWSQEHPPALAGGVSRVRVPKELAAAFHAAAKGEQLYDLERLWYRAERKSLKSPAGWSR